MRRSVAWLGFLALIAAPALFWVHPPLPPLHAQEAPSAAESADKHSSARQPEGKEEKSRGPEARPRPNDASRSQRSTDRLPEDVRTEHTLALKGRTLRFTATAGSIPITNAAGRTLAEIAYIAYTLNDMDPRQRPVTFALNGGPGAASSWLHIGAMGPWRLPLVAASAAPSAPPTLLPNAETWLDFTDLVFIDPVGTGYSHIVGEASETEAPGTKRGGRTAPAEAGNRQEGGARYFWSVNGDVDSLAEFIQEWLKRADRLASPKMLVGESYGGFRAPKIVHTLQRERGVAVNALVLISPVLDFEGRRASRHAPAGYANLLPSLAAATLERQGKVLSREFLREVETYARTDYLIDLLRGPRDKAAVDRIVAKVADYTSLGEDVVRRYGGRLGSLAYIREMNRPDQKVASFYDASVTGFDPDPNTGNSRFDDPFSTALVTPLTTAMVDLYDTRLKWRTDRAYVLSNKRANRSWVWGNSPNAPEAVSALKDILSLDARFRVLVAHGFTDLVTPYAASEVILDQLPAYGDPTRVASVVHQGGHMFYSRDASREALRSEAEQLLAKALQRQGM